MTEVETVGWYHRLSGYESEQTPGDGEGWGSLVCCSAWGHRVGHDQMTGQQQPCLVIVPYNHIAFSWNFIGMISSEPPNSPRRQAGQTWEVKVGPQAHMGHQCAHGDWDCPCALVGSLPSSPGKSDHHQYILARSMLDLWPLAFPPPWSSVRWADLCHSGGSHTHPSAWAPRQQAWRNQ